MRATPTDQANGATPGSGEGGGSRPVASAAPIAAAAASVLALYLVHPLASGFRFPVGPDGPVYTWLARLVEVEGFVASPGAGPAIPGLTLTLGRLFATEPVQTVMVLGPGLAAACGLAAAALLDSSLGPDARRAAVAVVAVGAFAAYLAGGWLANVAMIAVFLSAVAVLGRATTAWRGAWLGGVLLGTAALAHGIFTAIGLLILAGAVAAHVPEALRERRRGASLLDTPAARIGVGVAGGAAVAFGAAAWLATFPTVVGDTSQDGFFRRLGFRELILDRYRERLLGDLTRTAIPVASGLGMGAALYGDRERPGAPFLIAVCLSWAAVTIAGVTVLAITGWGPPNRVLQFAFFIPILGAAGAGALLRRGATGGAFLLVVIFVAFSMWGWFRQSPSFSAEELDTVARAGQAVDELGDGTPLIFVVDTDQPAAAYHVTRMFNVIRMAVPAHRIPDVRLAVGSPADFLASRPTITGDREHDAIARAYLEETRHLRDGAAVIVIAPFNPHAEAMDHADAADVFVETTTDRSGHPAAGMDRSDLAGGLGPVALVVVSLLTPFTLGLLGWGWTRWGFAGVGPRAVAAASPGVGIAVVVAATFAADRLGALPGSGASLVAVGVVAAGGYVLAVAMGRRRHE